MSNYKTHTQREIISLREERGNAIAVLVVAIIWCLMMASTLIFCFSFGTTLDIGSIVGVLGLLGLFSLGMRVAEYSIKRIRSLTSDLNFWSN